MDVGLHLLSEHGVGVYSLGKDDERLHQMLHHPSQTGQPDHDHTLPNTIPGCLADDVAKRQQ